LVASGVESDIPKKNRKKFIDIVESVRLGDIGTFGSETVPVYPLAKILFREIISSEDLRREEEALERAITSLEGLQGWKSMSEEERLVRIS
jgi:hypothetical protein